MVMELSIIYFALALIGLCFGSFAGASVWRLRARQLMQDKACGENVDATEYKSLKKLTKTSVSDDRSRCLHCSYTLKWYDLIPLVSWLLLAGKCRKCRTPIGYMEPLIELGMAAFFVLSYAFWPYPLNNSLEIARLILWLVAGIGLGVMFVYDFKWFLLPDQINFAVIGVGFISALTVFIDASDKINTLINIAGSIFILSGIYLALYIYSKGRWIGFGDIKLGLSLGLLLSSWELSFIALFTANLIGVLVVLPAMIVGRLKRDSQVPFGPLLIVGFVIAGLFGHYLLETYSSFLI
jgi:leader peptidase (prepilin peptidase)/N-methyltransferase